VTSKTIEVVEISDNDESDGPELGDGQPLNVSLCAGPPLSVSPRRPGFIQQALAASLEKDREVLEMESEIVNKKETC
jgi:hypothetical protein